MKEYGIPVEVGKQVARIAGKCVLCILPLMPWKKAVAAVERKHKERARRKRLANYDRDYENLCKEAELYRSL